jgi:hypothetical protein
MPPSDPKPQPTPASPAAADIARRLHSLAAGDFDAAEAVIDGLKSEIDRCAAVIPAVSEETKKE